MFAFLLRAKWENWYHTHVCMLNRKLDLSEGDKIQPPDCIYLIIYLSKRSESTCHGNTLLKLLSVGGPIYLWMDHISNNLKWYPVNWWQQGEAVGVITSSCKRFNPSKTGARPVSNNQVTTCACKPCYKWWRGGLEIIHCHCAALVLLPTSLTLFWRWTPACWIWNTNYKVEVPTFSFNLRVCLPLIRLKNMLRWSEVRWLT